MDKDDAKYIDDMKDYIAGLRKRWEESPKEAKIEAIEALIRTGVLDSEGKSKKSIVPWG